MPTPTTCRTHQPRQCFSFFPNTSGVRNAKEAVLAAHLSREIFHTDFLKLEIHPDPKYLLPDPIETLKATEQLAAEGFHKCSLPSRPTRYSANVWRMWEQLP